MKLFDQHRWDNDPQHQVVRNPIPIVIDYARPEPLHIQRIKKLVEALQALHKIKYRR